ncbi:MAG: hypothetical protein AAFQ61_01060 [Cyanobacteria bacterium J06626_23]
MSVPTTRTSPDTPKLPEWNLTQQWEQLGIRYCRHVCKYESSDSEWTFKHEHTLGLLLSPRPFRFLHRQNGRIHTGLYRKGDLLITPADTSQLTQAEGDVQIVQIRIQDSLVRQVAEETLTQNGDRVELIQAFQTRDPQVEAIATMLLAELHSASLGDRSM